MINLDDLAYELDPKLADLIAPVAPEEPKPAMTTITKVYPCGCSATGQPNLPDYCPTHTLGLYRCKICGTRWLLWPDGIHGGGWNLLDNYCRPGACCDNVAMRDQIEHLRDILLTYVKAEEPTDWQPMLVNLYLKRELCAYLDTLTIHGDNIGQIRRSLCMPFDSAWNGIVRDETAARERSLPAPPAREVKE